MQDLGPAEAMVHWHGLLADDASARQWLHVVRDAAGVHALSPSDVLTIGILLARSTSSGRGECVPDAEDVLGRAVSSRSLDLTAVNHAARLAAEVGTSRASVEYSPRALPWLRNALPALLAALLRQSSPRAWALAEESSPILARIALDANAFAGTVSDGEGRIMPLLESLVRASQTAESVSAMENGKTGLRKEAAAARALSSALSVVPEAALGAERPWRLLMDVGASDASATSGNFEMSSVLVAVGGALARVTSVNDARRDELCAAIEQKLKGSTRARASGLDLLRAVLGAPKQPFPHSVIALSVRWALHAVSSAKVSSKPMDSNSDARGVNGEGAVSYPHRLVVSVAAVLVSAARYLAVSDLAAIQNGWLEPRMAAQALTWRRDVDHPETPPVCTVRSHVSIPMRERLPLDAISALFHADLVLTAYIDPGEFRSRVIGGGLELAVAPSREERNKDVDDVEHWGYQTGAAVMTILANVLQACLDAENERDIMQEVRGGFYLGMQTPDVRRALLHRLSNLLALQRGIRDGASKSTSAAMPCIQVSTWLSAVECVLSEDELNSALVSSQVTHDVPDVEPALQAGVLTRAATAVSGAVGLCTDSERDAAALFNPGFIISELVSRDILRKSLKLAERLAPNVNVNDNTPMTGTLSNRYQMLAERLNGPQAGKEAIASSGYGRWASTSASTRASIVAGCFELCSAAAQAPAPPELEAAVMLALATPALHLESSDESDIDAERRLAVLQWVAARATECAALRAAAPALSLGATLLRGLPIETAKACTSMVVTAHASAALWGHAEANSDASTSGPLRAKLLRAAHDLTLKFNGTNAAVSVLADIVHVIASTVDPVPTAAAAISAEVVLRLVASHMRRTVEGVREAGLAQDKSCGSVDAAVTIRLGKLIAETIDAAGAIVVRGTGGKTSRAESPPPKDAVADMLRGANEALVSLVSSGIWIPTGGKVRFDDVVHAAYQSSGRLGIAVDKIKGPSACEAVRLEIISLRSNRVAMRAATALRSGERLHDDVLTRDDPETRAHSRRRRKYGKLHWVDLTAEEPSSEESDEDVTDDDDDDAIFCVRPHGGSKGISGWELDDSAPFPVIARAPPIKRRVKKPVDVAEVQDKDRAHIDVDDDSVTPRVPKSDTNCGGGVGVRRKKAVTREPDAKKKKKRKKAVASTPKAKRSTPTNSKMGKEFLGRLEALHKDAGDKLRIPTFCGEKVDVFKLFNEVQSRGGSEQVTVQRQWKQVAVALGHDLTGQTAASFAIRSKYEKCFAAYEDQLLVAVKGGTVESEEENTTPPGARNKSI